MTLSTVCLFDCYSVLVLYVLKTLWNIFNKCWTHNKACLPEEIVCTMKALMIHHCSTLVEVTEERMTVFTQYSVGGLVSCSSGVITYLLFMMRMQCSSTFCCDWVWRVLSADGQQCRWELVPSCLTGQRSLLRDALVWWSQRFRWGGGWIKCRVKSWPLTLSSSYPSLFLRQAAATLQSNLTLIDWETWCCKQMYKHCSLY